MNWLLSLTLINAIFATIAFALVVALFHRKRPVTWLAMVIWFGHSAIFYLTLEISRRIFGYTGPGQFFSTWSAVKDLHAYLSIVGFVAVYYWIDKKRMAEKTE